MHYCILNQRQKRICSCDLKLHLTHSLKILSFYWFKWTCSSQAVEQFRALTIESCLDMFSYAYSDNWIANHVTCLQRHARETEHFISIPMEYNAHLCRKMQMAHYSFHLTEYCLVAAIFKIANCPILISLSQMSTPTNQSVLVVSARKWFCSVDRYGRRLPSLLMHLLQLTGGI